MLSNRERATIYKRAAEIVGVRWTRGTLFEPSSGRVCLGGALMLASARALPGEVWDWGRIQELTVEVARALPVRTPPVSPATSLFWIETWNDMSAVSGHEVKGLLNQIAWSLEDSCSETDVPVAEREPVGVA